MILVMKDKIEKSKASQPLAPTSRIDTRRALHPHELDAETKHQIWVPPGFIHGFCVTSEEGAEIEYKCTAPYDAASDLTVLWNDPDIGIAWPIDNPVLSEKDENAPRLADVQDRLSRYEG